MNDDASTNRRLSLRSILLGMFVLLQLIYLPLSNLMKIVPREMPPQHGELDIRPQIEGTATSIRPIQDAINGLGTGLDLYGEATGQAQAWSLFAPEFGKQTVFPVVDFEFDDGNERYLMRNEPHILRVDPSNYYRWPSPYARLFGYEYLLGFVYWYYSEESLLKRGEEWRTAIRDRVRGQQKSLEAYFRFSLATLRRTHPDLPEPRAGILNVRIHPSPRPGERERPPAYNMPLARWIPDRKADDKLLPIEAYDPIEKKFVALERE